jgi:hypothetical protein
VTAASAVARAWRGVRWYLREFTGEFERRRADALERTPVSRCC